MDERKPRHSPVPFQASEARLIREMVRAGTQLTCPQCGAALSVGAPIPADDDATFQGVVCGTCERGLLIRNPERRINR